MVYNIFMANENTKVINTNTITGISIIRKDGKVIYSPFFSNKGYILTPNNARKYTNYINGYIAAMVIFLIAYFISDNFLLSLLIFLLVIGINIAWFYTGFIKKASTIEFKDTVKEKKDNLIVRQARDLEYPRIRELIICCILLVLIFAGYYFWKKPEGIYFYIVLIAGILSAIYLMVNIAIWFYKKKHFDK